MVKMKKAVLFICLFQVLSLITVDVHAQSYIDFSTYTGGTGGENVSKMQVVNGETYVAGVTDSPNFPVTNGSVYKGNTDLVITKYSANGSIIYSTYLGSIGYDNFYVMKIINGEVYLLATADSSGYPVTNGSIFRGGIDIVLTKLNSSGAIVFSSYLGGSLNEYPVAYLLVVGNEMIISGETASPDFPVTNGTYNGGIRDAFITKVNANTGAISRSIFVGGSREDNAKSIHEENGFLYLVATSFSPNLPVTIGNSPGPARNAVVLKLTLADFNVVYYRYVGGTSETQAAGAEVLNGEVHFTGFTFSQNFPVTNGSSFSGLAGDYVDGYYVRLNTNGSIGYATYLGTEGADYVYRFILSNGEVFLYGNSQSNANPLHWDAVIFKINTNGSIGYTKKLSLGTNYYLLPSIYVLNGNLYVAGITKAPDFPVSNGGQFYNGGTGYFTRLDGSGNVVFSSFLGKMNAILPVQYVNNKFYLLGQSDIVSYPVTDSSLIKGEKDHILIILNPDGSPVFGSYIGGSLTDVPQFMEIGNNSVYICGVTSSVDYPVTDNTGEQGYNDQFLTKLSFCPATYNVSNDSLSPLIQTVCRFGLAEEIAGTAITVFPSGLPVIYLDGVATQQTTTIKAVYQWQVANTIAGPWTNIPGASFKNYRPVPGVTDQYYRRLSFTSPDCGSSLIHISDTAVVIVNNLTAPVIDGGGPFFTCPGSAVTIGGSPAVSGGNPPYISYVWDWGAGTIPNPVVTPTNSTIYTLVVTDAAGCRQIGQSIVLTYKADAGPDKSSCAGAPVRIGSIPVTGITGAIYNWQPAVSLSAGNIAQPFATPPSTTDYILTLTIPKSGGGTCSTTDTVKVMPVAAPVTQNFAGPDRVVCLKTVASLGTPPEPGFQYTWSPGSYLTSNTNSTTNYYAGNTIIPNPDPATIYLTARKDGCSFSDEVVVTTIESRAGFLACGPRLVGLPDRTPDVNETYAWTRVSGPGNFTGPTNLPQVPVSASVGGTTVYRLTVSYNGGSCTSQVEVPELCIGCNTRITVDAAYGCASFGVNGGNVTLNAFTNLANPVFSWSPQVGLSTYTGNIVQLTDNVPRTYTVTATDISDTSLHCSGQIFVNDPAFSLPVFSAPDTTICANTATQIGVAPVVGYTYQWFGPGLSSNTISNPLATLPFETTFPVKITDGNGCEIRDTVVIGVQNVQVNAGQDWVVCSNAVIQLGTPAQPNTNYSWQPSASPWLNGTNQFSAQPEVLVASAVNFTVTATTSAGCVTTDEVQVVINDVPVLAGFTDTTICRNSSVRIGPAPLPGVNYQWTPAAGLSNPSIAQPLASPAATTTYTLLATFPGSCASPATLQVTVTVSDPSFNIPDISFCPANGPIPLGNNAPANMASYNWTPQALVTDPFIANPSTLNPPPNNPTTFSLSVVDGSGCAFTDNITLVPVTVAPTAGPDKTICRNQSTSIGDASNVTGPNVSYIWSPAANLDDPASPNPVFTGTTGGLFTYILIKTDNNVSCSSTDTVMINVADSLIPVLNTPVVCQNSCVQIGTQPQPGVLYQWTPSAGLSNAAIANPLVCVTTSTINYILTASNAAGCTSSANVVVGVSAQPAPQVTIPDIIACTGDNTATFNPVISPIGNYSYLWSPDNGTLSDINSLSPSVPVTNPGISQYSLQVTDNLSACSNTAFGNLIVNNCPSLASIGDFLWYDSNTDGIQDPGEPGVSGMIIRLYNSAGFNVATTVTNAAGLYLFDNIPPGNDYYVIFSRPAGFGFTQQNAGGPNAQNNSKADTSGRSNNFNIPAGASILTIDAGIIPPPCGPVPVTLLSFTGVLQNKEVLLNWQTTAEFNNDHFDVERSADGVDFIRIGRVNGNGTTELPHNYSMTDSRPFNGLNYYRLNQVDFDGQSHFSHIVKIQLKKEGGISAQYNTGNNTITLSFTTLQNKLQVRLYAANGQLIKYATTGNNILSYTFELPVLASGIYMLQVKNDELMYSKKLFIRKQ
jgi:hypothetical protein